MEPRIRILSRPELMALAPQLAALVLDAVADGASVGYLAETPAEVVQAWWLTDDGRVVCAAEDDAGIAGVAALLPARAAFQPHRAEIAKVVVHRRARRRGLGEALVRAAEAQAARLGRSVLTLHTRSGCEAEQLYRRLGWQQVGRLPDDSLQPDGRLCDAAIYAKRISTSPI